ncbi:TAXI family TRAP transporter solute-binding subunit [Afifella sp. JA880]|uniref:TAXI family TRAP transporter solute-binding subunit n=1 Tax=Afifella sp. JA880 TaxID=2975280 RepID=UPI0028E0A002|nr:TAXI family TRAP transporter solute-binding subunit [Afifella sp. JA880]
MLFQRKVLRSFVMAATSLALVGAIAWPSSGRAQEEQNYLLATASTGGTYYPVGVALATLIKVKLQPTEKIGLSAINSAGSAENIKLMRDNEVQFAILQGLYGAYAKKGSGPLENEGPQENLRSVTMLWPNVEHFVLKSDLADTGTIADVANAKGKSINLGAQNSGTLGSNRTILGNLGYDIDQDFTLAYSGYGPAAEALQNGQVVLISTPAGPPVGAISQAFANMGNDITVLDFTDEEMQEANGDFDELWTRFTIPPGTYPGQEKEINTIAQPNFLAVRDDVPEETIYKMTKTIYENLPFLQGIHPATKNMKLEAAIAGLPLPLHPGAARYYEEQGITIPDRLKVSAE